LQERTKVEVIPNTPIVKYLLLAESGGLKNTPLVVSPTPADPAEPAQHVIFHERWPNQEIRFTCGFCTQPFSVFNHNTVTHILDMHNQQYLQRVPDEATRRRIEKAKKLTNADLLLVTTRIIAPQPPPQPPIPAAIGLPPPPLAPPPSSPPLAHVQQRQAAPHADQIQPSPVQPSEAQPAASASRGRKRRLASAPDHEHHETAALGVPRRSRRRRTENRLGDFQYDTSEVQNNDSMSEEYDDK